MRYVVTASVVFLITVVAFAAVPQPKWENFESETGAVAIVGNIQRPGDYVLPPVAVDDGSLTLRQLYYSAGALKEAGEQIRIEVRRANGEKELLILRVNLEELDAQGDVELRPNDFIYVTEPKVAQ